MKFGLFTEADTPRGYSVAQRYKEVICEAQFAEDMGLIQPNLSWPYSSLDWSDAAAELMQDYCEEDGYYFRR